LSLPPSVEAYDVCVSASETRSSSCPASLLGGMNGVAIEVPNRVLASLAVSGACHPLVSMPGDALTTVFGAVSDVRSSCVNPIALLLVLVGARGLARCS
jgi:hypothetical protein